MIKQNVKRAYKHAYIVFYTSHGRSGMNRYLSQTFRSCKQ